jgi:drug/metabolite transporter (DMT)-like permease
MELKYLFFIIISSFLHASYNFLMKKNGGSQYYLNGIFLFAAGIALFSLFISGKYSNIPWHNVPYIFGASFFYILYQIFVNKSYQRGGNISTNYPLTVLSPLFIPIWAFFLLGEKISIISAIGIIITVSGAVMMQINKFTVDELKKIIMLNKDYIGAQFAISASIIYSFGAIFDKFRISTFDLETYLGFIIGFMSINMLTYMFLTGKREFTIYTKNNWKIITVGGIALYLSFLFFRLALQKIDVSIAIPLRQFSVIFVIFFGVVLLKEKFKPVRSAAIAVILAGIILINLGL